MTWLETAIRAVEATPLPDSMTRMGINFLVARTKRRLAASPMNDVEFAQDMRNYPIAEHTDVANEQHYELPPAFFELTLGPRRKYSCCRFESRSQTLAEAEYRALEETLAHADILHGQSILELGCGWGALTLFMAERFPKSKIMAVSNSEPQRLYIEAQAKRAGLTNITLVTADMNDFQPGKKFDRIVSVEMFEHMANWHALLERARDWLKDDGRLFLHIFTHRSRSYRFDRANKADWIAQHFFTGGIMPSHDLITQFSDLFTVERKWRWGGELYQRTALAWLANFDSNRAEIDRLLADVYGNDAALWRRRWRLFYLATAGLFGHARGSEWGVSHYLLAPMHRL